MQQKCDESQKTIRPVSLSTTDHSEPYLRMVAFGFGVDSETDPFLAVKINMHVNSSYRNFNLMAKPTGPRCNMRCDYCFYLEKEHSFPEKERLLMTDEVLEAYTRQYIKANDAPEVVFAWQGGEPTLMGIDFFKKAVALQKQYGNGKRISNTLQTNGTLLNDEWCHFLAENCFLVGLSLDGPREIHDRFRKDRNGNPTFDRIMQALEQMKRHMVEFNVLVCITRESAGRPGEVYHFLKKQGVRFIQFIPVVERCMDREGKDSFRLSRPDFRDDAAVAPWSVDPRGYGDFLIGIFDEWVRRDVGKTFIMNFEWTLANWVGAPQASCSHSARCGQALIMEHNGDVYCCDHYMFPEYRVGNILTDDLAAMVSSEKQRAFGASKEVSLPDACRNCRLLFACHGGCLKYRFARSPEGEPGMNYLCQGTKRYFSHVERFMNLMAEYIKKEIPVSRIMETVNQSGR